MGLNKVLSMLDIFKYSDNGITCTSIHMLILDESLDQVIDKSNWRSLSLATIQLQSRHNLTEKNLFAFP